MSLQKVFVTGKVKDIRPLHEEDGLYFTVVSSNRFVNGAGEVINIDTPYEVALRNPVGKRVAGSLKEGTLVALVGEFISVYPCIYEGQSTYELETYNLNVLEGDDRSDLQAVVISGNLGKDAEMRYTPDAVPVANGSIAVNAKRKGDELTFWFNYTAWRGLADVATQWFKKGKSMILFGRMQVDSETGRPRTWETQDGDLRSSFEMTIDTFAFGGGKNGDNGGADPVYQGQESEGEEIPF